MSARPHPLAVATAAGSRPIDRGQRRNLRKSGFTLIELGVVVAIIAVLVSILLPVIHKVRVKAYGADTSNELNEISSAIERYNLDQHAYPGPLANDQTGDPNFPSFDSTTFSGGGMTVAAQSSFGNGTYDTALTDTQITMSENLVLGLLGGLWLDLPSSPQPNTYYIAYDPTQVGQGPQSLANNGSVQRYPPYIEARNLSWTTNSKNQQTGRFTDATGLVADGLGSCYDSLIPEFVDRYPNSLPILYLRAKPGPSTYNPQTNSSMSAQYNPVITDDPTEGGAAANGGPRCGVYDINQIAGYTRSPSGGTATIIGTEKETVTYFVAGVPTAWPNGFQSQGLNTVNPNAVLVITPPSSPNYYYPYDAFPYFASPNGLNVANNVAQARNQDGFILISAGEDRTYGTTDDITSFGSVLPQ